MASTRPKPRRERAYDLTTQQRQALADIAQGIEETDAGLACSYLIDQTSGEGADFDAFALDRIERYVDRAVTYENLFDDLRAHPVVSRWRERIQRARRALARLRTSGQGSHASCLMVAYGHVDPFVRAFPELCDLRPELASLIRYTEATEQARLTLVRAEALDRSIRPDGTTELACYARLLDEADRILTSADAVRAMLHDHEAPIHARPNEHPAELATRREARARRRAEAADRRACYVATAHAQATTMLAEAEQAFRIAWLSSANG